ncbi:serine hydrolase domain-containing protein [Streptomyces sp. MST-110588]|uniref:serine hydrolase domain-containing protein n=1 Tax=Streptomyces sp. MST-110588 TaxID=2833628 RepID=UPI001F5E0056|nr:serine hydrolase domain-containing protein [Streptomyces sp. MST-110588]UNO40923.1 beta-lactamase family protein [Streptomyces sp. MST-110588]
MSSVPSAGSVRSAGPVGPSGPADPAHPAGDTASAELLPGTRRALLHRLAVGQTRGRAPSMVGAVARGGRMVWSGARGTVGGRTPDADVQYRIGSLTKTFVAVMVMRLRDEGLLRLDDPIGTYLDGTSLNRVDGAARAAHTGHGVVPVPDATVAQLLSHSSGLAAEPRGPWWERTPGELRPEPADLYGEHAHPLPAGRGFHYSNTGYAVLGMLVERLRGGTPWGETLRREVLDPLGLDRTTLLPQEPCAAGWAVHPWADALLPEPAEDTGLMGPAGQLWSTAADMCRWAAFLMRGDDRVLSARSLDEMRTPAVPPEGADWDAGFGLGIQLVRKEGRRLFGHGGSMPGFLASLWCDAEEDLAGVTLANCTSGPAVGAVTLDLLSTLIEHEPRIPGPWRPMDGPLDQELLALTGPWYWGAAPYVLRLRADRMLEIGPTAGATGRASRFRAEPDGTWTGLDGYFRGETLRVVRAEDGSAGHLDVGTFVFTRGPYEPSAPVPGGVDPEGWRV